MASGNNLQENILSFDALSDRTEFYKLSEEAWLKHPVPAGMMKRTTVMGDFFHKNYVQNTRILDQTVIPESLQQQRFVDEVHDNKDEVLLAEIQQSEGRESCVEESTCSIKETCADHVASPYGNKEVCANNLSSLPSGSLCKKTAILTNGRKWIDIDAYRSHGGVLSIQVSKLEIGASLRS